MKSQIRKASVFVHGKKVGILEEIEKKKAYRFTYEDGYKDEQISVTMPIDRKVSEYKSFPPFFEGLLPEGFNLEALLKIKKIDYDDCFSQLTTVGADLPGAVTVREIKGE